MIIKKEKGEKGYLKERKIVEGVFLLLYLLMIAITILWGIKMYGDKKNIWTVFGIMMCIPFAKFASEWVLIMAKPKFKDALSDAVGGLGEHLLFDMVLSTAKGVLYADYVVFDDSHLILLASKKKVNKKQFETTLEEFLKRGGLKAKVGVMTSEDEFLKTATGLNLSKGRNMQRMKELLHILHI